jgi:phosphatidylglycerophosphatase A
VVGLTSVTPIQRKIVLLSASGAGVGYFPFFPGTMGTLIAIPVSIALNRLASLSITLAVLVLVMAIYCAITLSSKACEILGQKDPQIIVIDEIVGFLLANFAARPRISVLLISFILFRSFDIAKVFPASRLEQLPGGLGVVLDDVMAGIYTFAIMQLLVAEGMV